MFNTLPRPIRGGISLLALCRPIREDISLWASHWPIREDISLLVSHWPIRKDISLLKLRRPIREDISLLAVTLTNQRGHFSVGVTPTNQRGHFSVSVTPTNQRGHFSVGGYIDQSETLEKTDNYHCCYACLISLSLLSNKLGHSRAVFYHQVNQLVWVVLNLGLQLVGQPNFQSTLLFIIARIWLNISPLKRKKKERKKIAISWQFSETAPRNMWHSWRKHWQIIYICMAFRLQIFHFVS